MDIHRRPGNGWRLTGSIVRNCRWGNCDTDPASYTQWENTYTYDADANVETMTQVEGGTTRVLAYDWEPGTHNLVGVTRTVNGSVNYSATLDYDRLNRTRTFCENGASGSACQTFGYIGTSDWLSFVMQNSAVIQRYLYANGKPLRLDLYSGATFETWYYRYNARGDAAGFVDKNGEGSDVPKFGRLAWDSFGAWGDVEVMVYVSNTPTP